MNERKHRVYRQADRLTDKFFDTIYRCVWILSSLAHRGIKRGKISSPLELELRFLGIESQCSTNELP